MVSDGAILIVSSNPVHFDMFDFWTALARMERALAFAFFQFFHRITTKQNCFKCPSFCSYHHFEIKARTGAPFIFRLEDNEYDPYALACFIPSEMDSIPEALRMKVVTSKSLYDVKGVQIGRVEYILDKNLHDMFQSGQISRMDG